MTAETIREFLKRQPFVPFSIHLNDGRTLDVKHPDFVVLPPGWDTTAIVTYPSGRFDFVYVRNVTSIESEGSMSPRAKRRKSDDDE